MEMSGAQFSAINSLRTGNPVLDMTFAMLVPVVFRAVFEQDKWKAIKQWLLGKRSRGAKGEASRIISCHTKGGSGWAGWHAHETKNHLLQKAVKLYLTEEAKVKFPGKAQVQLTAMHDTRFNHLHKHDKHDPIGDYRLTWIAAENEWVEVEKGLRFRHYHHQDGGNGQNGNGNDAKQVEQYMVFELSSSEPDGAQQIDAFVERAVDWYKDMMLRTKDDRRFMYTMVNDTSGKRKRPDGKEETSSFAYKRYELSDMKTFGSLFFPEKDSILRLLRDFEGKEGKYSVAGFPHKLGLLLHGPPGTGKTSLIKALAHHTGRSIINVSLSQIETNRALHDCMYDLDLSVVGKDHGDCVSFRDVIFVIEDVDACSKIVQRRDRSEGESDEAARQCDSSDDEHSLPATVSYSEMPRHHRTSPTSPPAGATTPLPYGLAPPPPMPTEGPLEMSSDYTRARKWWSDPDELNLAGLLNVLDGVVDTPGRILIMTTNHPEKLDPALIRPGRIDRCLLLGYLKEPEATQMISHYFRVGVTPEQRARLSHVLGKHHIHMTPAMMEQRCAEHDSVDTLLDSLDKTEGGTDRNPFESGFASKRQRLLASEGRVNLV